MARGVNKVQLIGNLGDDPEVKYTQGGMAVTRVRLATTSVRKNRDGETLEETQWHRVVFFGKLGEIAGEYLNKGSQVYVEGSIRYSEHEGNDGVKRYYTDIIADEMQMLGGRGDGGGQRGERPARGGGDRQQRQGSSGEGRSTRAAPPQERRQPPADDFSDDDIPF